MTRALLSAIVLVGIHLPPHVFGGVVMTPELIEANRKFTIYAPFPEYPASARQHQLQGSGVYLLHLRKDGTVKRIEIVQSMGYRELDDACLVAFKKWRFRPDFAAKYTEVKMPVTLGNP